MRVPTTMQGIEMNQVELIAKQQLEIENLKLESAERKEALEKISLCCVCIGGPLNDNCKGYTREQMADFFEINTLAESAI